MGIRGLYSYTIRNSKESLESFTLKNTKIIIDGRSILYELFDLSQRHTHSKYIIGSDYEIFSRYATDFFKKLLLHKVDFLIILNGCCSPGKQGNIEESFSECISSNSNLFIRKRREGVYNSAFQNDVFQSVLRKLKIKFIKCTFDSTEVISVISKILDRPILTGCADYFLYGNDCILFDTLVLEKYSQQLSNEMVCQLYRPNKFVESFPGLNISCLPLLSVLLDQEFFSNELLQTIVDYKPSKKSLKLLHNKIQASLTWLSKRTFESAIEEITSLLTPTGESSKPIETLIEARINKYTTFSELTLKFILEKKLPEIDEEKVCSVQDKFLKFTIEKNSEKEFPSDKLFHKLVERNDDVIKQRVYDLAPKWLLRNHSKGYIHSFIINMVGLRTFIPFYFLEDLDYPSAYEMSIPLIKSIYSLVLSSIEEDSVQPLNFMSRKNHNLYYKEIQVDRYPENLSTVRLLDLKERLKIINNALGIEETENFRDLPQNWRLYVATAIYWFKQDVEPKKNKNHLKALLLAMFFSITKSTIQLKKNKFLSKHNKNTIESILSTTAPYDFQEEDITPSRAFGNICRNDALITLNYLLPLVKNQTKVVDEPDNFDLATLTIHIYSQFEICLSFSKTLNGLLNLPYYPTKVEYVLLRPLIYNLYLDISQQPNTDEYIAKKLNHAPNILKCFKVLLKKIESLLDE